MVLIFVSLGEGDEDSKFPDDPSTSIVGTDDIGEYTRIGPFSVVEEGAVIGKNCIIGQGCYIQKGVVLSDGIHMENGVYVWEGVYLEEDVFVGPQAVFTNTLIVRAGEVARSPDPILQTKVGKGASLGANCTILCGHIIGPYSVIGAGSTLTHSVRAHEVVVGNPARHQGWRASVESCCTTFGLVSGAIGATR